MRKDIPGPVRKRILLVKGVGIRNSANGIKKRKTVCGNTIHEKISQVCLKIIKYGKKPLEEKKEGEEQKPEEKKEEKVEKKAEEPKKEAPAKKPEEKKEEKVAEKK